MPGYSTEQTFARLGYFRNGMYQTWPGGGYLNASRSRDPWSSVVTNLQPGLFMGQRTANNGWQPAFVGVLSSPVATGDTTITVTAAMATEIVRRIGSTGTLLLIGPTTANGTVASSPRSVTYSAVNTTTGAITVTATGTNEVQTLNIGGTPSGGTFKLGIPLSTGVYVWTDTIAHNATFGTVITNINAALDNVLGASKVVASGSAYTAIALTFSGTGFAATDYPPIMVDVSALTDATTASVAQTTAGVSGAFAAGTLVAENDGSYIPKSFIEPGYGRLVATNDATPTTLPWDQIPMEGTVMWSNLFPVITDLGIRQWIKDKMDADGGFKFVFDDAVSG